MGAPAHVALCVPAAIHTCTPQFAEFHSPVLQNSDFDAKPMVLLLGQYSVGKTSFIRYLLGRDFPGQRIGPEPTTDRFVAVMGGPTNRVIPGNALAVQADMPFRALTKFGTAFLNKFEASICDAEILEKVFFVDTPGVLSGEKQRIGRSYDFVEVVEWFSERADMILLLFDAHKLDISDEFKRAINALKGQDDKVRVVLNKADRVTTQQLMRVYGALMWSLGKVVKTPEVCRVYIGSFWDKPLQEKANKELFEMEQNDLLTDLRMLPRYAAVRKINELVKRARLSIVHAHIIAHLKTEMPSLFGKEKKQRELIDNLHKEFFKIHKAHGLPVGDFPNLERMKGASSSVSVHARRMACVVRAVVRLHAPRVRACVRPSVRVHDDHASRGHSIAPPCRSMSCVRCLMFCSHRNRGTCPDRVH